MGKATRRLLATRKECFEPVQDKPLDNAPQDVENDGEYEKEKNEIRRLETSFLLRKRLMHFVEDEGLPLCEFLDIESLDDFVQWVLSQDKF